MLTAVPLRSSVRTCALRSPAASRSRVAFRTMASAKLEMWVKGDPKTSTLGDCPFCHRVLLSCEEKQVPYTKGYIDFAAKPDWLLEVNPSGTVPVAKDLDTGAWIVDSGVIAEHLEAKYPEHPLGQATDVASKLFPAFVAFFKAAGADEAEKEATLLAELQGLADALKASGGPFIGGASPNATDMSVAPKVHHMMLALEGIKGWQLPDELSIVETYVDAMRARPSWVATRYPDDMVLKAWRKKLEG